MTAVEPTSNWIVHFGVGNFHRSHQAMYLDRLHERGRDRDWAICGIGLLPGDRRIADALHTQHFEYTLVTRHADGSREPRTISAIRDYLFAPDDPDAVLSRLADPTTRIVSLTITEGAYRVDPATGEFDLDNPDVAHDLAHPNEPRTVFGYIVEALRRRRAAGLGGFTVMSCDNIQGNGDVAYTSTRSFADAVDPELGAWIGEHVSFPNSMVDRITPVTTDADRAIVREQFGIEDDIPVMAEPFSQWVLEDDFVDSRPDFAAAGVQLVDEVAPYELMKLRLLNATHQALAYLGALSGHAYVHEAASDGLIASLMRAWMAEALPTLAPVPGIDLAEYQQQVIARFANPQMQDTIERICTDASNRLATFLVPVVRENLQAERPVPMGAAVVATWALYRLQVENPAADPHAATVDALLAADPLSLLGYEPVFGAVGRSPELAEAYARVISGADDVRAAVREVLDATA